MPGLPRTALQFAAVVFGATLLCTATARATDVSGDCPMGGFTAVGSPWNFTGSVSVPEMTTCTVEAGATLNGNGNSLTVSGTLNAAGASSGSRNVVFNDVAVNFQAASTGMLQYCTVNAANLSSSPISLQGAQTVTDCTIKNTGSGTGSSTSGIFAASGAPTISNNTITGRYGIYVQSGTPLINNNTITTSFAGIYYDPNGGTGGGTASENTIGFSGSDTGRYGIYVLGSATPTLSHNTIHDDTSTNDIAISAQGMAAGVQIKDNTVNVSGGDYALQLAPAVFQAGSQVSGNSFPTGLAAGVLLTGQATGTVTLGPLTPGAGPAVTTYVVDNVSVATGATLTIAAGVTLAGASGTTGKVSVNGSGTLNAVGASDANRNVVFNNVGITFDAPSHGMLQSCTVTSTRVSYPILVQGAQTVTGCTISNDMRYGVYVASGKPTISSNMITAPIGIQVTDGTPAISSNTITASDTGISYGGGGGTAGMNTIDFSAGGAGRYGIHVLDGATPTLNGNTIGDDAAANDIAISAQGTAAVQISNNTVNASGGDYALEIVPLPGLQVSGNSFPTGLAAGVRLTGEATGMVTVGPLTQAAGTVISTYVVDSLSVAAGATLTIAPGVTLTNSGAGGSLTVSGTLNAVGASSGNRNVVFNNVGLTFEATSTGMLQFCTIQSTTLSNPVLLLGAETVTGCTINNGSGYGVYVQSGTQTISDNEIAASEAGIYYEGGGGTASGNTIGFIGSSGLYGIFVSGSAAPTLSGNTILDYTSVSTGIEVRLGAGNAMTQILNNVICTMLLDEGKSFIDVPDPFAGTKEGNLNQCNAPTRTPTLTPLATATGTVTRTPTVTPTGAATPSQTPAVTASGIPTSTRTNTATATTATATPTRTPTVSGTQTTTATLGATPTRTATATVGPVQCPGDCSGDGQVTVNELIEMVNIALGTANVSTCRAGDANGDGEITINEIIAGVNNALNGCP